MPNIQATSGCKTRSESPVSTHRDGSADGEHGDAPLRCREGALGQSRLPRTMAAWDSRAFLETGVIWRCFESRNIRLSLGHPAVLCSCSYPRRSVAAPLQETEYRCKIEYEVRGMTPGLHGFHVHEKVGRVLTGAVEKNGTKMDGAQPRWERSTGRKCWRRDMEKEWVKMAIPRISLSYRVLRESSRQLLGNERCGYYQNYQYYLDFNMHKKIKSHV